MRGRYNADKCCFKTVPLVYFTTPSLSCKNYEHYQQHRAVCPDTGYITSGPLTHQENVSIRVPAGTLGFHQRKYDPGKGYGESWRRGEEMWVGEGRGRGTPACDKKTKSFTQANKSMKILMQIRQGEGRAFEWAINYVVTSILRGIYCEKPVFTVPGLQLLSWALAALTRIHHRSKDLLWRFTARRVSLRQHTFPSLRHGTTLTAVFFLVVDT